MEYKVYGVHFGRKQRLADIEKQAGQAPLRKDPTFLLFQPKEHQLAYFKDFGAAVFINMNDRDIETFLGRPLSEASVSETYWLTGDTSESKHDDLDYIHVPSLTLDVQHIVCLNIAQSLALHYYQNQVDRFLKRTRKMTTELERTGKIRYSRKRLGQMIGQIMNLRNSIEDNLYIFEAPPLAWQDQALTQVDEMMAERFDFTNRHRSIQNSVAVIRENHEFFNDMLQHKHSSLLEWIIILLILFEVIHVLIK
jgi:uncharacterized Rmd1/YagE family protein